MFLELLIYRNGGINMDYNPNDTIRLHMEQLTNEELLDIWIENRRDEYTDKTFVVIHDILEERGVTIPQQSEFIENKEENNNMTLGGFFSFQFMISSKLIQIIYILGAIGITVGSVLSMSGRSFWMGILGIVIGNLVWRLVCETAIIFFRMNEQLGLIHQELKAKH